MTSVLFYLLIYPLSKLPLRHLHHLSKLLYPIAYYVIRYRRAIVRKQLIHSFPNKTSTEIIAIEKGFYRNFCKMIMESVRLFSITEDEVREKISISNATYLDELISNGKGVIVLVGHLNNWELMCVGVAPQLNHTSAVIYSPLSNSFMDRKVKQYRSRLGMLLFSRKEIKSWIKTCMKEPVVTFFLADQFPKKIKKIHHTTFLNQPTEVAMGAEIYARKFNWPVVYLHSKVDSNGIICLSFQPISDQPTKEKEGAITEMYVKLLEEQILESPESWLWTHRRWKKRN